MKVVLDNTVYMGKIAYGRRRTEKKIGSRNETHVVEQDEFPIYERKHEAIISAMFLRKRNNSRINFVSCKRMTAVSSQCEVLS